MFIRKLGVAIVCFGLFVAGASASGLTPSRRVRTCSTFPTTVVSTVVSTLVSTVTTISTVTTTTTTPATTSTPITTTVPTTTTAPTTTSGQPATYGPIPQSCSGVNVTAASD